MSVDHAVAGFIKGRAVDACCTRRGTAWYRQRKRSEFSNSAQREGLKYFLGFSFVLRTVLPLLSALLKLVHTVKYSETAGISRLLPLHVMILYVFQLTL
jgi:hypothetical protein